MLLIFGRSDNWDSEQKEAYRILNSSYHSLIIMTYDHVLLRAKIILNIDKIENKSKDSEDFSDNDIPF